MKHAAHVHVELVKLMNGLRHSDIPQYSVVQHQVVRGVKCGTVPLVVVGQCRIIQSHSLLPRVDVIDLYRQKCTEK